jgi:hypothetical protein
MTGEGGLLSSLNVEPPTGQPPDTGPDDPGTAI